MCIRDSDSPAVLCCRDSTKSSLMPKAPTSSPSSDESILTEHHRRKNRLGIWVRAADGKSAINCAVAPSSGGAAWRTSLPSPTSMSLYTVVPPNRVPNIPCNVSQSSRSGPLGHVWQRRDKMGDTIHAMVVLKMPCRVTDYKACS